MGKTQTLAIFHLYRKDGSTLFLHPFLNQEKLLETMDHSTFIGKYGIEPRVESMTMFRNDLYRLIENAVNSWVREQRFIPRFLISSVMFLLIYFFFALVFRDPIPMVDEILLAIAGSVITYILLVKRDQRSNPATKKRVDFRRKVDQIVFTEDPFVKRVEKMLHANEELDSERIFELMLNPEELALSESEMETAKCMVSYLDNFFKGKEYKKQEKMLNKATKMKAQGQQLKTISRWAENKKLDISLFATYKGIKILTRK